MSDAAAQGTGSVWVRNTVGEAQAAVNAVRDRGVAADLLLARFTVQDRKRHEAKSLEKRRKPVNVAPGGCGA